MVLLYGSLRALLNPYVIYERMALYQTTILRSKNKYSQHGLRIIALCYKQIDIKKEDAETVSRDLEDKDFIFLGFIIFANKLKVVTKKTIDQLHEGGVSTLMATGDNALTAVNVAKK